MSSPKVYILKVDSSIQQSFSWIDNPFIHCKELFPDWHTVECILSEYCKDVKDWEISCNSSEHVISISLAFPTVKDELTQELVPMNKTFPKEVQAQTNAIVFQVMQDYLPNLDSYLHSEYILGVEDSIRSEISQHEQKILHVGGRMVFDELRFRLGLFPGF